MARRRLLPGELVAARPTDAQTHIADRFADLLDAMRAGRLLAHEQYRIVEVVVGRCRRAMLVVGLHDDPGPSAKWTRVTVPPSSVRLWGNPKERAYRREFEASRVAETVDQRVALGEDEREHEETTMHDKSVNP